MKVVIHIGMPKTGTSAIQKFLLKNREWLHTQNMDYPEHTVDVNGISSGNGAQLLHWMSIGEVEKALALKEHFLQHMKGDTLLISSENFYREPALTYALFPEAEIVVYIREQSEQIVADYNQSVKRHFQIHFFDHVLKVALKNNDSFYNFELLEQWSNLYGQDKINVRIYDPVLFSEGNIVYDFLAFLKLTPPDTFWDQGEKVNVSYYRDALHFKIWINRLTHNRHRKFAKEHKAVDYALQAFSQALALEHTPDYLFYTEQQKEKVKQFYQNYNQRIAQKYFRREVLFPEKESKESLGYYGGLSDEKVIEIARYVQNYDLEVFQTLQGLIVESRKNNDKIIQTAGKKLVPLLDIM